MRPSLQEATSELERGCELVRRHIDVGDWVTTLEAIKVVMRAAGQLHGRVRVLAEMYDAGEFTAAVDRAVHRQKAAQARALPAPIPGDQPLPFEERKARRRRPSK